ncbi:MAG: UvrD-helicase domain-containing protein [Odoribacteraceae bacterium]|nr:UvrD-helicase domain-containing protein [Odoribacteraceae bacterium]
MSSKLKIYKASAGSGKTFALAMEFFKIVFASPPEYKNVLAVTFTNKATGEMKSRIVRELHKLASGEDSPYKQALREATRLSDTQIQERAALLQTAILHDYGRFSVTTIDRFFQRLLKAFTRELGIFPGYNVELDSEYVLSRAVDMLMQRGSENRDLGRWITELMEESVEDARSWNVKGKIAELGKELFGEHYKLLDEKLLKQFGDRDFLSDYRRFLNETITAHERQLHEYGERACRAIEEAGLTPADFKRGARGFVSLFARAAEGVPDSISDTTRATVDAPGEWTSKQQRAEIVARVEALYPLLNDLLEKIISRHDVEGKAYRSARQLQGNLYQLGILNDLAREVRAFCEEKGVMLLSDATHLLNLLIDGNDTPFLFEKCGNFYHHVMIDEFQDTSTLQWANFRPLVVNTLAEGGKALLVGDVKQSIYRWRNGDWSLLAGGVEREFQAFGIDRARLDRNWRSRPAIVEFNNLLFRGAARRVAALLDEETGPEEAPRPWAVAGAYEGLEQQVARTGGGYVEIHFSPAGKRDEESDAWIMERVTAVIRDATGRGTALKDCVILVRTAKEGAFVADYLMAYNKCEALPAKIPFVSNDSLFLASSPGVKLIINVLRYLAEPFDAVNRAALLYHHAILTGSEKLERLDALFDATRHPIPVDELVPGLSVDAGGSLPGSLFEGVEEIIRRLGLTGRVEELPYLIAFQDAVFDYEASNAGSIPLFLEWWEKEAGKRVLSASEEVDAVRVLTIHKSKGLEFNTVILPFCCWELDAVRRGRRVWGHNREEGFRALEMAPLNYSSRLKDTYFSDDYNEERAKSHVDNLNLLYVALTRAGEELYVFPHAPAVSKEGKPADIGALLHQVIEESRAEPLFSSWDGEEMRLTIGQRERAKSDEPAPVDRLRLDEYPVHPLNGRVSVRYRFQEYADEETNTPLDEGKLLHELFKRITTRDDVAPATRSLCLEGLIPAAEEDAYRARVEEYLRCPLVSGWFDGRHRVMNEREILLPAGRRLRPDRVMLDDAGGVIVIDYKFGRREEKKHADQVRGYRDSLSRMNYREVSGYLWYVTLDKVIQVPDGV